MFTLFGGRRSVFVPGSFAMESLEARRLLAAPALAGLYHTFVPFSQPRPYFTTAVVGDEVLFAGGSSSDLKNNSVVDNVVDIYNAKTGEWSAARLSQPRSHPGEVISGSRVLFYGGNASTSPSDRMVIDIFDSMTNRWSVTRLPDEQDFGNAVAVGDQVVFSGGFVTANGQNSRNDTVQIYHTVTGEWTAATLPKSNIGYTVTTVGTHQIFLNNETHDIESYNSVTGIWSHATFPVSTGLIESQIVANDKLGIFYSGGVSVLDPVANTFATTALAGEEFSSRPNTVVGSKIVFDGGDASIYGLTYDRGIFDVSVNTWTHTAATTRHAPSATTVGTKAIFAGGSVASPPYGFPSDSVAIDVYDSLTNQWETLPNTLAAARGNPSAFTSGHLAFFGSGYELYQGLINTIDVYDDAQNVWSSFILSERGSGELQPSPGAVDEQLFFALDRGVHLFSSSAIAEPANPSPAPSGGTAATPAEFKWDACPEATNYDVYLDDFLVANVATNQWTVDRVLPPGPHAWQVVARSGTSFTGGPRWTFVIGAPSIAANPVPEIGTALPASPVKLSWDAFFAADSYDVYLDGALFGNVSGNSTLLGGPLRGGGHTWRVDGRNGFTTTIGPTWAFTTPSSGLTHSTKNLSNLGEVTAVTVGKMAIFASNTSTSYVGNSTAVDLYDSTTRKWSTWSLSKARGGITTATVGNKAIFAGGESDAVDIYNAKTHHWSTGKLSGARDGMVATTLGNNVLFAGGSGLTDAVDIYHSVSGSWSKAKLSQTRSKPAGTSAGHFAFVAGGITDSTSAVPVYSDVVDIYDARRHRWSTARLSLARAGVSAVTIGSKVVFAGGYAGQYISSDVVDIFDLTTGRWSVSKLPQAGMNVPAVAVGHQVIFAGGRRDQDNEHLNGESNLVEIYNADSGQWSTQTIATQGSSATLVRLGARVLIASGYDNGQSNVIDVFDTRNNSWTIQTLSYARFRGRITGTAVGDVAIFAGGSGSSESGGTIADLYAPDSLT